MQAGAQHLYAGLGPNTYMQGWAPHFHEGLGSNTYMQGWGGDIEDHGLIEDWRSRVLLETRLLLHDLLPVLKYVHLQMATKEILNQFSANYLIIS